jgi:hypothetical protein
VTSGATPFDGACVGEIGIGGNISVDPLFASTDMSAANPYQLQLQSPAVDTGMNNSPDLTAEDLLGNPRVQNARGLPSAIVDMGVYEYKGVAGSVVSPDFSLQLTPTSLNLAEGGQGKVTIALTPNATFAGAVSLACASLPSWLTCSFSPQVVGLSGGAMQTSTLIISSTVAISSSVGGLGDRRRLSSYLESALLLPWGLSIGLLVSAPYRLTARKRKALAFFAFALLPLLFSACGVTVVPGQRTNYTVVVQGSSGVTQSTHAGNVSVTVN